MRDTPAAVSSSRHPPRHARIRLARAILADPESSRGDQLRHRCDPRRRPRERESARSASTPGARPRRRVEILMRWRNAGSSPWPSARLPSPSSSTSSCRRVSAGITRTDHRHMSEPARCRSCPAVTLAEFIQKPVSEGGRCVLPFIVDPSIPGCARGVRVAVMAYSRADEPVCVLDGGARWCWFAMVGRSASPSPSASRADAPACPRPHADRRRCPDRGRPEPAVTAARPPPCRSPRVRSAPRADAGLSFVVSTRRSASGVVAPELLERPGKGIDSSVSTSPGMFGRRSARQASSSVAPSLLGRERARRYARSTTSAPGRRR